MANKKNKILSIYLYSFLLYEMVCYLANAMIMPSMLQVVSYLRAQESDISLTVIAYMVGVTITPLIVSPIAGIFGRSKIIILGCAIFSLSNLLCPFSNNIFIFSGFRFIQGVGQGFIFLGYTMIHDFFDDISAVKLTTLMANITVTVPIIGPVLGSVIAVTMHWKYVFWLTGGLAIISLFGLIKWSPIVNPPMNVFSLKRTYSAYRFILFDKKFLLGVLALTLVMLPTEFWMIFSVIIVEDTLRLSLLMYNIYMMIIVGACMLSSLVLRKIIHLITFYRLIIIGCFIYIFGAFLSILFSFDSLIFVICLALSAFGGGLFRGIVYRKLITSVHEDKNAISALYNIVLSFILVLLIYCANRLFQVTNYSLCSFGWFIFAASIGCFLFILWFVREAGIERS